MSVKNLLSDNQKPDQILNVSALNSNSLNLESFANYTVDYDVSIVLAVDTYCGEIAVENWTLGVLLAGETKSMIVLNPLITSSTNVVLLTGVTSGNADERLLRFSINTISANQFSVDITNTSSTIDFPTMAQSQAKFLYCIVRT